MSHPEPLKLSLDAAEENYLLHRLVDSIPDRIYFKDRESRFLLVNKALLKMHGLTDPSDMIGKTDYDFFSEEHASQAYQDEQSILKTGETIQAKEEKETWPDGSETWVSTTKMPLVNDAGSIVGTFGISRDITDRIQARDAIREAERTKVMMESLGGACHHLGQPATVLLGGLSVISDVLADADDETLELVDECKKAAEKVGEILKHLTKIHEYKAVDYLPDTVGVDDKIIDLD